MSGYLMRVLMSLIMKTVLRSPEEVDRTEIKREGEDPINRRKREGVEGKGRPLQSYELMG